MYGHGQIYLCLNDEAGGLVFGMSCRFVPTTWWSLGRIVRWWYVLRRLLVELR